jgi:hypothetical protein
MPARSHHTRHHQGSYNPHIARTCRCHSRVPRRALHGAFKNSTRGRKRLVEGPIQLRKLAACVEHAAREQTPVSISPQVDPMCDVALRRTARQPRDVFGHTSGYLKWLHVCVCVCVYELFVRVRAPAKRHQCRTSRLLAPSAPSPRWTYAASRSLCELRYCGLLRRCPSEITL